MNRPHSFVPCLHQKAAPLICHRISALPEGLPFTEVQALWHHYGSNIRSSAGLSSCSDEIDSSHAERHITMRDLLAVAEAKLNASHTHMHTLHSMVQHQR